MAALEIRSVSKALGGNQVVTDISLSIEDGEFLVLLGPSGGGKSTLLRMVCGLETPDSGQVFIDGKDMTRAAARERNLGMVFQDYGLYPNMNVFQNIAYGLEARGGLSRSEIEQRVTTAAGKLGLSDKLKRNITELSGGEQQRVALSRAMAKDANAYLYDEPLSNLDPKLRHTARRDIMQVHTEKGKPSLYVTHDQTEAFSMADRIALIGQGRLQQLGTPDDLLHRPANIFVARFIGAPPMNLLWGAVERAGGGFVFQGDGLRVPLPERLNPALERADSPQVVFGLRPDALVPVGMPAEFEITPTNTVSGGVVDVDPLIGETVVSVKIGKDSWLSAMFQEDGDEIQPGQTLSLGMDLDQVRLFDPHSEQAIG
ncbi:MAG: ABC transporter ATP-binding protein [Roseiflexaceae bacterium]|nr:ABC transporter ATP-binding protein [Roseiflexaceae bacterium]